MSEEVKMPKKCPFCGKEDLKRDVEYQLAWCDDCFVFLREGGGGIPIDVWNRRTPEPGTSVVRWVRYDGTEGTLPRVWETVLLKMDGRIFPGWCCAYFDGERSGKWAYGRGEDKDVEVGDVWGKMPEPPEEEK